MHTLKYLSTSIAVGIILLVICSIIIMCKLDKYRNDLSKQAEFCKRHSKKILVFLIISIILFVGISICYALIVLKSFNDSFTSFIMVSMIGSTCPLIIFSVCFMYPKFKRQSGSKNDSHSKTDDAEKNKNILAKNNQSMEMLEEKTYNEQINISHSENNLDNIQKYYQDWENSIRGQERIPIKEQVQEWDKDWENYKQEKEEKERLEREQIQKEKEIQEQNSILHLTENEPTLTKKYSSVVFNFIEKLTEKYPYIFLRMFNNTETLQSSILVKPYQLSSQLLTQKVLYDGLKFTESDNAVHNKKIQEITDFFIKGLKKRILENGNYNDEFTFPTLLYYIVRNNVIKYYRNEYMKAYGYESLEEFCCHITNPFEQDKTNIKALDDVLNISRFMSNNAITEFVYYYIYENDIELPFIKTYQNIVLDMKKIFERKQKEKLEEELFGKPKKKIIVDNTEQTIVSIIDRIDKMSGEQFEIFMEQFFISKGFKVTRTPLSGDYGVDIIIENDFGKIGVQAKCYSNKASLSAVQEIIGGLRHYNLSSGMVVTNNYFQPSAILLAADNNITLWDRNKLIEQLEK